MNRTATAIILIALPPVAAFAGATGEAPPAVLPADETRMSVEIPLQDALRVTGAELLRVNDLLDERTEFEAKNFRLAELVLVARSEAATAGEAELLIMDWRSGEFDIPAATKGEWYEVRIPAPEEHVVGSWLLDLVGDVTVDMLVAVLEPSPEAAALYSAPEARTVYRVVDGRRAKVTTRWVHSPHYYHVYHYHHGWPYRYFWGDWHYELVYRPHFSHYRYRHYRHHDGHRQVRHKLRDSRRHHRKLRRVHPRARVIVREHRADRARHTHRTERRTPRAAPRRDNHPNRHLRPRRGERQHASARAPAPARTVTVRTRNGTAVRRGDVARPLPNRGDYVRTAPSRSSRQAPRATATQPRAQTTRRAAEPATVRPLPRQREFVRRPAPRPAVAPVERSVQAPAVRQFPQRPADSLSRRTAAPPPAPQPATPRPVPTRRDFDRSPPRQATYPRPQRAPAPPRTEVRPRPQPQAAPPAEPPPRRATTEPRHTEPPRSHRPSREDRPERHLR